MRIFVAKFNFDSEKGPVLEGALFAVSDEHYLPMSTRRSAYLSWSEESGKYFTELDMVMKAPEPSKIEVEFNGDYAPKRKKKTNASSNEKTKIKKK